MSIRELLVNGVVKDGAVAVSLAAEIRREAEGFIPEVWWDGEVG